MLKLAWGRCDIWSGGVVVGLLLRFALTEVVVTGWRSRYWGGLEFWHAGRTGGRGDGGK